MGGCPFHDNGSTDDRADASDDDTDADDRADGRIGRRDFVRSALLIGGGSAVTSLGSIAGLTTTTRAEEGNPIDAATRLNRQHAWDAFEKTAGTGNSVQPAHSLFLLLEYQGDGSPTPGHRRQVATALRELERHFEWHAEGLLFTIAYSASYFERFDADPPPGAAPTPAPDVVDLASDLTPYDPEPDQADAVLLLTSDNAANLLAAEAALWGESGDDVPDFEATFEGVFTKPESWPDRRVGEAGPAFQDKEATYEEFLGEDTAEDIPDQSPLSMGFIAGFDASIPQEEAVTLKRGQRFPGPGIESEDVPTDRAYVGTVGERDPGVFAQGTLKHLSYLTIDLDAWYERDREQRRHQMYSPYHDEAETTTNHEKPGSGLVDDPGEDPGTDELLARETAADGGDETVYSQRTPDTATEGTEATDGTPTVAHSQKAARARYDLDGDGDPEQPCLRRDWDGIRPAENGYERQAGYHFNVPMRFNESIFTLLDANYSVGFQSLDGAVDHAGVPTDAPAGLEGERNGIAPFMNATRRANWLVPPITLRALPHPRAGEADLSVDRHDHALLIRMATPAGDPIDRETIRVGSPTDVDQAGGVTPVRVQPRGGALMLEVPAAQLELEPGDTLKVFAKTRDDRKPVTGTVTL